MKINVGKRNKIMFDIDDRLLQTLNRLCLEENRTKASLARHALSLYLKKDVKK